MACEKEQQIRILLERYFEGMTTLEEERLLREYFSAEEDIPYDLRYAQALFGVFHDALRAVVPDTHVRFQEKLRRDYGYKPSRTTWIWTGAAAVVAAVFILTFVRQKEPVQHAETIYCYVNSEPVTDYESALRYTENTLTLISGSLKQFEQIVEAIETISQRGIQEVEFENE